MTSPAPVAPPAQTPASRAPIRKVLAATAGAGLGASTSDLVIGGLADVFNHGDPIPGYLSSWLAIVIPAGVAALGGYFVKRAPGE